MSKRRKQSNPQRGGPPPQPLRPGQRPVSLSSLRDAAMGNIFDRLVNNPRNGTIFEYELFLYKIKK